MGRVSVFPEGVQRCTQTPTTELQVPKCFWQNCNLEGKLSYANVLYVTKL
jgi:hypothetical protein